MMKPGVGEQNPLFSVSRLPWADKFSAEKLEACSFSGCLAPGHRSGLTQGSGEQQAATSALDDWAEQPSQRLLWKDQ